MADLSRVIDSSNDEASIRNPQGCQKVAGGRSEAKTSGSELLGSHPEGVRDIVLAGPSVLHPLRVLEILWLAFRWSPTTGYYLAALRAAAGPD
jgi:hypothetical protein